MQLTVDNYYLREADMFYMSASQYKRFAACESQAMAVLTGAYRTEQTVPMLVGSYVDAALTDDLDRFKTEHPEILKRDGTLKSDFIQAEQIIERINRDEMFRSYLAGQHQTVMTGKVQSVPWKIKMDSYFPGRCIVDLKVMANFKPVWKNGERLHWISAWGYDLQMAVYQFIEGHHLPVVIAGITKEYEPDMELYGIDQDRLDELMQGVKNTVIRYDLIKKGEVTPDRCELCDWCRSTRKITQLLEYRLDYRMD